MPVARSLLLTLLLLIPMLTTASPRIVVSIQPLHSLVSVLTEGLQPPTLLIPAAQSPHGFRLRPSNALALHRADLVIWVGESLETSLAHSIDGLGADTTVISALALPGMALLAARAGGLHSHDADPPHDDAPQGHPKGLKQPASNATDPHFWLNPENMQVLVDAIAARLASMDPGNAQRYHDNAATARQRLTVLDSELQQTLTPLRQRPFLVVHDAFQYLEQRYRLNSIGSITVSPERRPGARRLVALRRLIRDSDALCLFAEPQVSRSAIDSLISASNTRSGTLDPIGTKLQPGVNAYFKMLRANAEALRRCLTLTPPLPE